MKNNQTVFRASDKEESSITLNHFGSESGACSRAITALETQADGADIRNVMCLGQSPDSFGSNHY